MSEIHYIDRQTKKIEKEHVYGKFFLHLIYGKHFYSAILRILLLPFIAYFSFPSRLYGKFQKSRLSKFKVVPFIKKYQIDATEFLDPVGSFQSFNDFFIRKLKPSSRPITDGNDIAVLPADGRYLVFPNILRSDGFVVKGEKFTLETLIQNKTHAHKYHQGSMVIARLCPLDYHRFHFPCNNVPGPAQMIPGPLFSVNPIALKRNISFLAKNKRMITELHTKHFGIVLFIEVGATYVGSIHQTYQPEKHYAKGDEKGYFSFGGSCVIMLFEPFRIQFDQDLIDASNQRIEILGLMGQSLGRALSQIS